jgi:hypothetical protein
MRRIWWVLLFLGLNGCFLVVGDDSSSHSSPNGDIWFNNAYASCDYDYYSGYSYWSFYADVWSYYGADDVSDVTITIDDLSLSGSDHYDYLYYTGYGMWEAHMTSWYYDCNYSYDLLFTAYDYGGNWTDVWITW